MDNNHPIQLLWKRNDTLAQIELYSLGNSLRIIKNNDSDWINGKIKRIKNRDIGAIFEILAAAMFEQGKNHEVFLPPGDNPGFDLTVLFKDNSKMNVSCKSHRRSEKNKIFDNASEQFKKRFKSMCENLELNIQCVVSSDVYPEENPHWMSLNRYISEVLLYVKDEGIFDNYKLYSFDNWIINISYLSHDIKNLNKGHVSLYKEKISYNLGIFAPFHKNEFDNITSHINDAIDNLSKKQIQQDENNINVIFINLGENYKIDYIEKWAEDYLKNYEIDNIAGIYFQKGFLTYESYVFEMNYVFRLVKNSNYYDIWNSDKGERILNLIAPMGIFAKHTTIEPHRGMLCTSKGKIKKLDIPNQNIYNYHNGEIYLNYQKGLENLIGTPGLRYYWVKQSKNGTEINYYNNINQDYFSLL